MSMIRVLIADDHKMVREGLRRILEFDGEIQVIDEADNGEECIKKIRSSKPDIVLLDINMPVMNGIEALQEIRKKKLKTKVIILTVHNEIEYLLRAVDIGICLLYTSLVRESYRLHENIFNSGLDIVVVARVGAKEVGYAEIESALLHVSKLHRILITC